MDNSDVNKSGVRWFPAKAEGQQESDIAGARGDHCPTHSCLCVSGRPCPTSPVVLPAAVMLEGKRTNQTKPVSVSHSRQLECGCWICSVYAPTTRLLFLYHLLRGPLSGGTCVSRQDQPGLSQLKHNTCTSKEKNRIISLEFWRMVFFRRFAGIIFYVKINILYSLFCLTTLKNNVRYRT